MLCKILFCVSNISFEYDLKDQITDSNLIREMKYYDHASTTYDPNNSTKYLEYYFPQNKTGKLNKIIIIMVFGFYKINQKIIHILLLQKDIIYY